MRAQVKINLMVRFHHALQNRIFKKMKIGIITQPLKYNYGGLLQNFALQTVLKRMGHEVITLDVPSKGRVTFKSKLIELVKKLLKIATDSNGRIFHIWKYSSKSDILSQNTRKFINQYINSAPFIKPDEGDFDALIVGSDQVWRPMYADLSKTFFAFACNWTKTIRLAYAASFGSDTWEYTKEETAYAKDLVNLFKAVSVREVSGMRLCEEYLGVNAVHVLDPTMLLSAEDYIRILSLKEIEQNPGELFYYFLDFNQEKQRIVHELSMRLNLTSFTVNSAVEDKYAPIEKRIQPPVENWLRAFMDAKFVITDSFHGTVFSIIFNKPFVVLGNQKRGLARFESLLDICGLHNRLFNISDFPLCLTNQHLQTPNVNLESVRLKSMNFLIKNL